MRKPGCPFQARAFALGRCATDLWPTLQATTCLTLNKGLPARLHPLAPGSGNLPTPSPLGLSPNARTALCALLHSGMIEHRSWWNNSPPQKQIILAAPAFAFGCYKPFAERLHLVFRESCRRIANGWSVAEAKAISHASHRGHGTAVPLRVPLHPFALPAVACACGFGCTSCLSCLMPPPKNATVLTPPGRAIRRHDPLHNDQER